MIAIAHVTCSCHPRPAREGMIATSPRSYALARARELGVDGYVLLGRGRWASIVKVRTTIARELRAAGYSLPEIGRVLNRHHTSIMNLLNEEAISS